MSSITDDPVRRLEYRDLALSRDAESAGSHIPDKEIKIECQQGGTWTSLRRTADLKQRQPCDVKVIFTELDYPNSQNLDELLELFEHINVLSAFLLERLSNVCHSFGTHGKETGENYAWYHFLCKNIPIQLKADSTNNRRDIYEVVNVQRPPGIQFLSQANGSWLRSAYFLKCEPEHANRSVHQPSPLSSNGSRVKEQVTLVCFDAPEYLEERFKRLLSHQSWPDILDESYLLFQIVLEELFRDVDTMAWNLGEVFGNIEYEVLLDASGISGARNREAKHQVDFVALHSVAKHAIYIKEAITAMLLTLHEIQECHQKRSSERRLSLAVQEAMRHQIRLLKSTQLRVQSLEKRMQNIINLSFNVVTMADSITLRDDSTNMRTIATVTLVFLPLSTVATIFSTQFFYSDSSGGFHISPYFGLLWGVAVPVTGVLWVFWMVYTQRMRVKNWRGNWRWRRQDLFNLVNREGV